MTSTVDLLGDIPDPMAPFLEKLDNANPRNIPEYDSKNNRGTFGWGTVYAWPGPFPDAKTSRAGLVDIKSRSFMIINARPDTIENNECEHLRLSFEPGGKYLRSCIGYIPFQADQELV